MPVQQFEHQRFKVYESAAVFVSLAHELIGALPPGNATLSDQLRRASISVCLNIAEGAGEFRSSEKARFYRIARRSATECAAILARISHRRSTTSPQSSALAVFRSVGLLDVLYKYDCGGLGRKPCQDGTCDASLRQAMRNAG